MCGLFRYTGTQVYTGIKKIEIEIQRYTGIKKPC